MKAALIQHANSADIKKNRAYILQEIANAALQGAQLVVLQELSTSLYFCQTEDLHQFDLAEPLDGPTFQALSDCARQHKVVIVGSIFEKRAAGVYHNTAIVIEADGTLAGVYRKMHIPDDPGYYEKYYFTPGDLGFHPVKTSVATLGVLVCWDQWFPEAARLMALGGADLLIYPTAIGWDPRDDEPEQRAQMEAWMTIQRGHAIANRLHCIAVNRTGFENDPSEQSAGIQFWGNSFVCRPNGQLIVHADTSANTTCVFDIDLGETEVQRRLWPFLRDRRVEYYKGITRLFSDSTDH